jgi:hypothetical protein
MERYLKFINMTSYCHNQTLGLLGGYSLVRFMLMNFSQILGAVFGLSKAQTGMEQAR